MHINIDTNTLIDDDSSEDIAALEARPGALEVVQRLAAAGNEIVYYTARTHGVEVWLEQQRFPRGYVVHYHSVLYQLIEIYEREHGAGSAMLIDGQWPLIVQEFQRLAEGGYATRVAYWREVTTFLYGYLRLFAFGAPGTPMQGPMPAVIHLASWEDAGELLRIFESPG